MRFVKATERLPKHDWPIHVKIDGIPFMGNFYNVEPGGAVWFYVSKGDDSWRIPPEKFNGLEWLCEDEQDEGWVPVESPPPTNEKFNESEYYLCLLESTEYVVCWYNSIDKVWRVANFKADSLPLIGITHYRKLPQPPATT